ncbi:hypothetical protein NF27_DP00130 [Candidatus Jidaibacter acanthamoeba]|uniref:Uncharacterized protein n=1 Tax=Candidatus Jidaibacter acanthamoebae TaxID=86105 RepID=A0A0C1QIZ4_9RICK|nr:hypothetical protein [Candidatus Jidaibacter acanthamoeba]KIE05469.1 hypothetical protein NF27_DP00130 [Candidatus Jidaibacter acanthamoeba]
MGDQPMQKERLKLVEYGLKEALIIKLKDEQIKDIIAFSMDNIKASNLVQMLIQLASMEVNGKYGAAFLASEGVASTMQLKNLSAEQIDEVVWDYKTHQDKALAIKAVKERIIEGQQDKFSSYGYDKINIKAAMDDDELGL